MTEYRIAEEHNRFWIQYSKGMVWHDLNQPNVPRYFESLADARSWVATIKRGVVYHDAEASRVYNDAEDADAGLQWFLERVGRQVIQSRPYCKEPFTIQSEAHAHRLNDVVNQLNYKYADAPNLAQGERKAEDDTSDGIKPLEWFEARIDDTIVELRISTLLAQVASRTLAKTYHRFQTERG